MPAIDVLLQKNSNGEKLNMRNKHIFKEEIECRCPKQACGDTFYKTTTVEYTTNQRGDVIEHRVR